MKTCVNYNDKRWKKYKIDFDKIVCIAVGAAYKESEVSITLTNDDEIHQLNREYRNIDKPTNVLSFELGDDVLLGDIFISLDTVIREARDAKISVAEHTAHMVVHGVLHLLGFDHITDADAIIMENKEIEILKKLGIKNPYIDDSAVCSDCAQCRGDRFLGFLKKIKIPETGFWNGFTYFVLGVIASLGFAPFNMWWATVFAIGAAYWLTARDAGKFGFWKTVLHLSPFACAYAISMFGWILNSIYVVPELANQFAVWTLPAIIGIGIVGGIIFIIPFVVISRMRTFPAYRAFLFAAIWTLVLWLREWAFTGFPWNPLANIFMPIPMISNSMSVWGALGLTFITLGLIASFIELCRVGRKKSVVITFIIFVGLMVCGGFFGYNNIIKSQEYKNVSPIVRIVQPAKSQADKMPPKSRADAIQRAEDNIRNLLNLASASGDAQLVVFPETTYPFVITDTDFEFSKVLGKDVITGATAYKNGNVYNAMLVADSNGEIQKIYSKSHLVPFGEYSPLGIMPSPSDLAQGTGPEIITMNLENIGEFSFAPAICYEIIFSDSLIPKNSPSPTAIINITNDTWFGKTSGTYQHLDMVRRYAIESGVPVIRANYSGISAFVSADGAIISALPIGMVGVLDGFVWGAHDTIYRAIGRDAWIIIILLFSCICVLALRPVVRRE